VEDKGSRLFRVSVGTRRNINRGNKSEGGARLTSAQISQRHTKVSRDS